MIHLGDFVLLEPGEQFEGQRVPDVTSRQWVSSLARDPIAMSSLRHWMVRRENCPSARMSDGDVLDWVEQQVDLGLLTVGFTSLQAGGGGGGGAPAPPPIPPPVPPVPPPPPPVPGDLLVKVINEEDGSVVKGIKVEIKGPQTLNALTDGSGVASFRGIAVGSYNVTHFDKCWTVASTSATVQAAKTTNAELKVRRVHAAVTIKKLEFSGHHVIEKDTRGPFAAPEWVVGRSQADQVPVSYARAKKVSMKATFDVTSNPCVAESVAIKGKATFGPATLEWNGSVSVGPADKEVSLPLTSAQPLANEVGFFESSDITWEMNPAGTGFAGAGSSRNIVYVTLGDPVGVNFWTLLDISCRAAAGQTTEAGVIKESFKPIAGRTLTRKRDGKGLTYWEPRGLCSATNTNMLLDDANATGQCGSWAEFLIDMYKVHGISSADKILIERDPARTASFMVKNWTFDHPPASAASAFTHFVFSQCRPGTPLPGQRNSSPPPAFENHFIVLVGGEFWDPSYGAGPFKDQLAWENAAIDGLLRGAPPGAPAGTQFHGGFEKSLNSTTKLLEFRNLRTGAKI